MTANDAFMRVLGEIRRCEEKRMPKPDKIVMSESLALEMVHEYKFDINTVSEIKTLLGIPVEIVPDLQIARRL